MAMNRAIVILAFSAGIALALNDARPTPTSFVDDGAELGGWSPKPTRMASIAELKKRASIPDATCGYMYGSRAEPWECREGNYCAVRTDLGVFGCCTSYFPADGDYSLTGCAFHTACVPYAALAECTSGCLTSSRILKCTDTVYPYCMEWYYTDVGYKILDCHKSSDVVIELAMTYDGQLLSTDANGDVVTVDPTTTIDVPDSVPTVPLNNQGQSAALVAPTDGGVAADTAVATAPAPTSTDPIEIDGSGSRPKKKNNIAPVAGGAAGGAIVLIAAAASIWFFFFRRKKTAPGSSPPAMVQTEYVPRPNSPSNKAPEAYVAPVNHDVPAPPYYQPAVNQPLQQVVAQPMQDSHLQPQQQLQQPPSSPTLSTVSHGATGYSGVSSPQTYSQPTPQPSYTNLTAQSRTQSHPQSFTLNQQSPNAQEIDGRASMISQSPPLNHPQEIDSRASMISQSPPTNPSISTSPQPHAFPFPPTHPQIFPPPPPPQEVHGHSNMPPQHIRELSASPMGFRAGPSSSWGNPYAAEMP